MGFIHDRLVNEGHHVDYFDHDSLPTSSGYLRRFVFPTALFRYVRAESLAGRSYDIVNVHEPSAVALILCRRWAGAPGIVVTSHGVEQRAWELALEERRLGRMGPSVKTRLVYPLTSLWQSRLGLTKADHVFCLNQDDRAFLTKRFGVSADRITRIFPAADQSFVDAGLGRTYTDSRTVLFAGTWRKNKGIEDLVPAFVQLHSRDPQMRLRVLGAGVTGSTVRELFPESVRSAVECVTAGTEAETIEAFRSADLFVLPSLFEGTPLTLLEAMAIGLPVVTTATCGMKDVIEDGRNGLLVPIRSPQALVAAIERLTADRELRCRLGNAARRDAQETYTWVMAARTVEAAYNHLTGAHSRRPRQQ